MLFRSFPRTYDPRDVLNYKIAPVTVERDVKIGSRTKKEIVRVTTQLQKNIYRKIIKMSSPYPPYIIGISSAPHDIHALEVAGYIHYALLNNNPQLRCLWRNSWSYIKDGEDKDYDVVIIHNVTINMNNISRVRDILNYFNRSFRIVVVAGTNAVDFFDNYLHHGISGMIHIIHGGRNYIKPLRKERHKKIIKDSEKIFTPELSKFLFSLKDQVKIIKKDSKTDED